MMTNEIDITDPECVVDVNDISHDKIMCCLEKHGYAIITNVITQKKADTYVDKLWQWLEGLKDEKTGQSAGISRDDPTTWITRERAELEGRKAFNWPSNSYGIISFHGIAHSNTVWEARCEENIRKIFESIWKTNELLVSFDAACIMLPPPNTTTRDPTQGSWFHFDQSPKKQGFHCVQGFLNLSDTLTADDGCLMVYPTSNQLHREFFLERNLNFDNDWYSFNESNQGNEWFRSRGIRPLKVTAPKGSFVLWDSRTAHCSSRQRSNVNNIRYTIYICMQPKSKASEEQLIEKKRLFLERIGTNHWPSKNEIVFDESSLLCDDSESDLKDPRYFSTEVSVLESPSEDILKLVGY